jgi:hypothetical protein
MGRKAPELSSLVENLTALGIDYSGNGSQGRTFSRTIGTNESHNFSLFNHQVDIFQSLDTTVFNV